MSRTTNRIPPIGDGGGGGSRSATLIIAPNDATTLSKEQADFVATGVNDEVLINNVISQLPAQGGKIQLLEGTFIIEGTINLVSNMTLSGVGASTIIKTMDSSITSFDMITVASKTNIIIEKFILDGNYPSATSTQNTLIIDNSSSILIDKMICKNTVLNIIYVLNNSSYLTINDCMILNSQTRGIYTTYSDDIIIENNFIENIVSQGIYTFNVSKVLVNGNNIKNTTSMAINIQLTIQGTITGNVIKNSGSVGIRCQFVEETVVGNNFITETKYGIFLLESYQSVVSDNSIYKIQVQGMLLSQSSSNNIITQNVVVASGQLFNDAYPNIEITDSASYNNIQTNLCRKGVETNKPKYGILINGATCVSNLVTNNDLYISAVTSSLLDTGTSTVTSPGNRL